MNKNLNDTLWVTIWVLCVCIALWVLMVVVAERERANAVGCASKPGCENALIEVFPEGHGR
jgi:hypothetical protein